MCHGLLGNHLIKILVQTPPPALVFKLGLIILGSFGIINGGTKPHFSIPVLALNACRTPLLAVA